VGESNGPDITIRGTPPTRKKSCSWRATAAPPAIRWPPKFYHTQHYFRLIARRAGNYSARHSRHASHRELNAPRGRRRRASESFEFVTEPGFVPVQPQPFVPRETLARDHQREGQSYHRASSINRANTFPREHSPRERPASASISLTTAVSHRSHIPAGDIPDSVNVDRLPSFTSPDRARGRNHAVPGRFRRTMRRS